MNEEGIPRSSPRESSRRAVDWRVLASAAFFPVVVFAAYWPALDGQFIWDDHQLYVANNEYLRRPDGVLKFWFSTELPDYYPLAYTTFWLEWRWFGRNPRGYHLTNLAIHALAALAVWRCLRLLDVPGAWLAALLFAVHPVNVESVAWISQRKTILAGLLAFAATAAWLRWLRHSRRADYWPAVGFFALSLASKPSALALPLAWWALAWWRHRQVSRRLVIATSPFFALAAAFGVIGWFFQQQNVIGPITVRSDSLLGRAVAAAWAVWFYLAKDLWPTPLIFVYPRWQVELSSAVAFLPGLALLVAAAILLRRRQNQGMRALVAAAAWFVLMLFPALGFVDVYYWRYSLVADHYQYVALPAALAAVVGVSAAAAHRLGRAARGPAALVAAVVVTVLFLLCRQQARDYTDEETLWRATLKKNPDAWLAHTNLADILRRAGDKQEAAGHYAAAYRLRPDFPESHINQGRMLYEAGDYSGARRCFAEATRLSPRDARAAFNLGVVLRRLKKLDESEQWLRTSRQLSPVPVTIKELALTLLEAKQPKQALDALAPLVAQPATDHQVETLRGIALKQLGDKPAAIAALRSALTLNPNDELAKRQLRELRGNVD